MRLLSPTFPARLAVCIVITILSVLSVHAAQLPDARWPAAGAAAQSPPAPPADDFVDGPVDGSYFPPPGSRFFPPAGAHQPEQLPPSYPGPILSAPNEPAAIATSAAPVELEAETPPKIWEGSLEFGLDGSDGNSQTFNLHFGAKLKRETDSNILSSEFDYQKKSAEWIETANKAFLDVRFEHLFPDSPWTWFVHNLEDYDEFKAYDLRVSLDTGFGYQFIKNERSSLTGRIGAGATREIGGPNDKYIPDAVFGLEGQHKLNERQKIGASVEYRPDVTEFADYRLNTKLDWEVLLDEEKRLSIKVGILNRYDSYADGKKPNDIDYRMTLTWSFL